MSYTREQLIKAQQRYNQYYLKSNGKEWGEIDETDECATTQIDFLLSLIR